MRSLNEETHHGAEEGLARVPPSTPFVKPSGTAALIVGVLVILVIAVILIFFV